MEDETTVWSIARTRPRKELSEVLDCKSGYASDIANGKKPVGSTYRLALFAAHYGLDGDGLLESLREFHPEVFAAATARSNDAAKAA